MSDVVLSNGNHHDLSLSPGGGGVCACGEVFDAPVRKAFKAWEEHTERVTLLHDVRMHALAERQARIDGEYAIRRLLDLGVSARQVADAIGTTDDGRPLVSASVIQRLGRGHHEQSPRRRRHA